MAVLKNFLSLAVALIIFCALNSPAATLQVLHTFTNGVDGANPIALLPTTNGYFYGTAVNGGDNGDGAFYKITTAGLVTPFYSFNYGASDGANPFAALVLGTNGNLYGSAQIGGTNGTGTLFDISPAGVFGGLYSFAHERFNTKTQLITNADGATPSYALAQGTNGNFYGTTEDDGTNGFGTVFEMTYKGKVTILYTFTNGTDGSYPMGALLPATNGLLYGTTSGDDDTHFGTVFQLTAAGKLTPLYSFTNGFDGAMPEAGLINGNDGNFYGTATKGGQFGSGTIFQITPAGNFTVMHTFSALSSASPFYNNDGASPKVLILGGDGNFYGGAYDGGSNGSGCIYELTPARVFTTLYAFNFLNNGFNIDGANPVSLMQGTNGSFYGTAYSGGIDSFGTFFSLGFAPQITSQPANQSVTVGQTANFTVTTTGAASFQWQFNNTDLPGATNATLSLTNVQPSDAGYYQVVLTNQNGAVISSPVTLDVLGVPVSFSTDGGAIQFNNGQVLLQLTNLTGQGQIVVQVSTNLIQWTPIFTNPPAFGSLQVVDSDDGSSPARFYRAVAQSTP